MRSVVWVAACVRRAAHLGAVLARALRTLLAASAAGASGVCLHISAQVFPSVPPPSRGRYTGWVKKVSC